VREKAVYRPFEVAAVRRNDPRHIGDHRRAHVEGRVQVLHRRDAGRKDRGAQLLVEGPDLDHETAGEARAHALVEALELGRRPVRRDHDLAAGIDQCIESVAELLLDLLALDELHVVDDEKVDPAQAFLEGERRLRLERGDEAIHEAVGRKIDDAPPVYPRLVADRVQEMGLSETDPRVKE
jgi:hypothetical protein